MADNESVDTERKTESGGSQVTNSPKSDSYRAQNGLSDRIKKEVITEQDAPLDFSIKRSKEEDAHPKDANKTTVYDERVPVNGHGGDSLSESGESKSGDEHELKIGEPQTALPGMLPGTNVPMMAAAGIHGLQPSMLGAAFPFILNADQHVEKSSKQGNKQTRPFKAYPKDPLSLPLGSFYGIPGMSPIQNLDHAGSPANALGSEELFNQYRQYIMRAQEQLQRKVGDKKNHISGSGPLSPPVTSAITPSQATTNTSPRNSGTPVLESSSPTTTTIHSSRDNPSTTDISAGSSPLMLSAANSTTSIATSSPVSSSVSRKRPRTLPDEQKDEAYWERRRKNNEAAKRSRDARRAKEDEIAIRAAFLEQENLKLRVEVAALKNETAKLRCLLYNS